MLRVAKKIGLLILVGGCLTVSSVSAQDLGNLGSSSGIFRTGNAKSTPKNKPPTPKTTAPKKKPVAAKSDNAPSKSAKTSRPNARTSKPQNTNSNRQNVARNDAQNSSKTNNQQSSKTLPKNDVIITVGKTKPDNFDERLEEAIEAGNSARDERDYEKAEKSYRSAQSIRPRDSRAVYGLGNIYSDQQRWEEAEKAYRTAIQLEPNNPEAHIALSFVLTQPVAGVNLSDRYSEAEKMARRAVELEAGNPVAFDQLGVSLELSGKISEETQKSYETAVKLDPEFALAYAHLGRLLLRKGLKNESTAAYCDAIRLSTDVPTMILVADVMQSQQRFSESEQLLRRALREDPKNPTALFLLGRALTTSGRFEEAESLLKRSVEVSPNSFVSYVQLGSLYARRGNYGEAERTLMRALRVITPNERKRLAQEFEIIGDGLMRTGRKPDAARVYRQAVSLDAEKTTLAGKLAAAEKS